MNKGGVIYRGDPMDVFGAITGTGHTVRNQTNVCYLEIPGTK